MLHETEAERQIRLAHLRQTMYERMLASGPAFANANGRKDPGIPRGKSSTFTPSIKARFKQRKRGG